ncbi:hypothetical protein HK103_006485 [Boothiomyces macroporosus]|uniref:LEM-like domain-containing protein n=1 Tax=Boothiomyces macroporosus TaxID=261099 RepID=A0AAD5UQL5_9FUNG|nr:hypothetical protein HK103_006485 [Boothiomyces macroporosus]
MTVKPEPAEYLDPDYDPSKLTISHLCSILSFHSIELPAAKQRKQFYLDLWTESLLPRMSAIKEEMENIVPSNEGITLVLPKSKIPIPVSNSEQDESPMKKEFKDSTPVKPKEPLPVAVKPESFDLAPNQVVNKEDEDQEVFVYKEIKRKFETCELNTKKPKYDVEFIKTNRPDLQFKRPPTPSQRKSKLLGDVNNIRLSPTRSSVVSQVEAPKQERFLIKPELPGLKPRLVNDSPMKKSVKEMAKSFDDLSDGTIGSDVEQEVEIVKRNLYPEIVDETFDFDKEPKEADSEITEDGIVEKVVSSIADDQSEWVFGTIIKLAMLSGLTLAFLYAFYSVHSDLVNSRPISLLDHFGRNRDKVVGYFSAFGRVTLQILNTVEEAIYKYSLLTYKYVVEYYKSLPYSDMITREVSRSFHQLGEFLQYVVEFVRTNTLYYWNVFYTLYGKAVEEETIRSFGQLKEFVLFSFHSLADFSATAQQQLNQSPVFAKFFEECRNLGASFAEIPPQIIGSLGVGVVVGVVVAKLI